MDVPLPKRRIEPTPPTVSSCQRLGAAQANHVGQNMTGGLAVGRRILLAVLVAALAVLALALSGCGARGSLSVQVTTTKGLLSVTDHDTRAGKHTVWMVLTNPPKGRAGFWAAFENNDDGGGGSASGPLPAGTFRYVIYGADGVGLSDLVAYQTPQHRLTTGQATVP